MQNPRKYGIGLLLLLTLFVPIVGNAHELIPQEVKIFLQEHPHATPEELQSFLKEKTPAFAERYKTKEDVINLIRIINVTIIKRVSDREHSNFENFRLKERCISFTIYYVHSI